MMNLSPEKMRKIVEESVLSVQPADVKKYHGKSIPVGPQKLSSMKEKQIVNATGGFAAGCDREEIAVFCDGTLTSNGKKGLLFSLKGFYSAELNMFRKKSPLKLPVCYEELERVDEKRMRFIFILRAGRLPTVMAASTPDLSWRHSAGSSGGSLQRARKRQSRSLRQRRSKNRSRKQIPRRSGIRYRRLRLRWRICLAVSGWKNVLWERNTVWGDIRYISWILRRTAATR